MFFNKFEFKIDLEAGLKMIKKSLGNEDEKFLFRNY